MLEPSGQRYPHLFFDEVVLAYSQITRHVVQFLLQQSNLSLSVFWSLLPSVYFYSRFPKEVIVVIIIN